MRNEHWRPNGEFGAKREMCGIIINKCSFFFWTKISAVLMILEFGYFRVRIWKISKHEKYLKCQNESKALDNTSFRVFYE